MEEDERPDNAIAAWFADPGATQAVRKVGPGYTSAVAAVGGRVVRSTPPPQDNMDIQELRTAYLPRWRAGGVQGHEDGARCPLCYAGYVFGRVEQMTHPDLAWLCYSCQVELEAQAAQIAVALSKALGYAVQSFEVLTRFFGEVLPISPMARTYGHPYH